MAPTQEVELNGVMERGMNGAPSHNQSPSLPETGNGAKACHGR